MVSDGDLLMPGPAAEKLYGQSNWKDLYSVIKGGGEFRAVTPDGETVGRLDARFVAGRAGSSFSLGGRNWTLVKSDESHNLVVVVPGEEQKSKTFWTGGQSGYSPVICRAVQRILARGGSVLPLGEEDSGDISDIAGQLPHGLKSKGLFVWEHQAKSGTEVSVLAFRGRNANGVLATVLTGLLGSRVKTTYSDFSIDIQGLKGEDQGEQVADALRHLTGLDKEEVAPYLPTPSPDNWKFGQALPGHLVREMALADSYHVEEFVKEMNRTRVILLQPGFPGE
jgi:ATP-dependent Lhr-like helicase